jgi:PAS domain S-box-containing protein
VHQARPRLRHTDIPCLAGLTTAVAGGLILAGWAFNLPLLTTIVPGRATSSATSGGAFVVAGVALWLVRPSNADWRARAAARACAVVVIAIGLLSLIGHIAAWNLALGSQPSVASELNFIVVGTVLLLLSARRPRLTAIAQLLVLPVMYLTLAGLAGYLFEASTIQILAPWTTAPPLPTTILFLLLARGLLEVDPRQGLMAVITTSRPGGIMARRMLIAFTWISLGLGWLLLQGQEAGLFQGNLVVALFAVFNILFASVVVWHSARSLNRADVERERAEQELGNANAERQRRVAVIESVLESIADGVVISDERGGRIYNLAAKRLLGMNVGEIPLAELPTRYTVYYPDQKTPYPTSEFPIARALRGEVLEETDVFLRHAEAPDGRWVTISARPLRDAAGQSQGAVAILRDITARRHAEEARRRLAAIVEASDDAILSTDVGGMITGWNRGAERLLGYAAEEDVLGRNPLLAASLTPEQIERRLRLGRGERVAPFETEVTAKNGLPVPVLVSASPMTDAQGHVVGRAMILRDISESRRAHEARLRLAALVDSSADAIIGKDLDGTISSWNSGAERLYGYTDVEVMGRNISLLVPPERADEISEILQRINTGERIEHYETVRSRKDGTTVEVAVTVSPVYDSAGRIVAASTIARDISERRQAEAEIGRLHADLERRVVERTAELKAVNQELEAFAYSVSHDLRAPLRAIHGFAQLLVQEHANQLDAEARHYLERVSAGATRMGHLIDDLLLLSRVSRLPLDPHKLATSKVVQRALDQLAPQLEGRTVELSVGELPECLAEPTLLEQVFVNLISNALKYSRGREPARIEIGCRFDGDSREAVFFVKDNGVGFDLRYADKLFGVFQRLHRAEDYEGTGVGLAIVKRIIARHGGRVWAEAEPDKGASFYFTLGGEKACLPTAA